jgi:hypothetical protein
MQSAFEGDTTAIGGAGATIGELATELTATRHAWAAGTDEAGDAFGYRELAAAHTSLRDAWSGELGVLTDALDELATGLAGAAGGYDRADRDAAARTPAGDRVDPR